MARLGQEIMPLRYMKAVFINTPSVVEIAINRLIKPLLKKKLKERIIITSGDYEELYQYLDRSCLPGDYGGDYPTLKELSDRWHELESEHRDWYINDLSEQTDETKRLQNNDTMINQFVGFKASFKNLLLN
ncbi:hypothetical protein O3M35_001560 [Rhynocoris fuscipes]|uniref:CRAL-TRIO domain-containing protein n=1 Tax=Rhynocoris fuscipes TaxID=488301 RepID=A0AAW1CMY5_9HEMI